MTKIVDKLRDRAYSTKAGDELCEEAAALIEALEWRDKVQANIINRLTAEVDRLRKPAPPGGRFPCDETSAQKHFGRGIVT
jgi:hypothetical protein